MKANRTYIPIERLTAIAKEAGCKLTEKTTCIMVTKGTNKDNRLYIARTANVARINVNGFRIPDASLAATPEGGPVGTFLQVVRFDLPEAQVIKNFRLICEGLDQYKSEPKKPRGRAAGFRRSKKQPMQGPSVEVRAEETPEEHAERLIAEYRKKKQIASEMGYPLSPKTVLEYTNKLKELGRSLEA